LGVDSISEFDFEGGLRRLDDITQQIEEGETTLARSLELYKEGVAVAADCAAALNGIEAEIMILQQKEGEVVLVPFKGD